jgi:hypothetical protein
MVGFIDMEVRDTIGPILLGAMLSLPSALLLSTYQSRDADTFLSPA